MKTKFILGVFAFILIITFGKNYFFPNLSWAQGGGSGIGGPAPPPPGLPEQPSRTWEKYTPQWVEGYEEVIALATKEHRLILIAFCNDQESEQWLRKMEISFPPQADTAKEIKKPKLTLFMDLIYLMLALSEKEVKTLSEIKKHRNKPKGNDEPVITPNIKLVLDYKIWSFPQLIFCDWHGNELGRTTPQTFKKDANNLTKVMQKRQAYLEEALSKRFPSVEKRFKKEKEKSKFTAFAIYRLKWFSGYKGYEAVEKAKGYLEEIEKAGEEELNKICGLINQIDQFAQIDQTDKEVIIKELVKIKKRYKGLRVSEKAQEKIKELKEEDKKE